jgi:hypothetical protein
VYVYANFPRAFICFFFTGWRPYAILLLFFKTVHKNDKFTSHNYINVFCISRTGAVVYIWMISHSYNEAWALGRLGFCVKMTAVSSGNFLAFLPNWGDSNQLDSAVTDSLPRGSFVRSFQPSFEIT